MNQDPLEKLDAFYSACHTAPVPERLIRRPRHVWWSRLWIPAVGLGFGAAAALVLVASPAAPSTEAGIEAARAIARKQMPPETPPAPRPRTLGQRRVRWSA